MLSILESTTETSVWHKRIIEHASEQKLTINHLQEWWDSQRRFDKTTDVEHELCNNHYMNGRLELKNDIVVLSILHGEITTLVLVSLVKNRL